MDWAEGGCSLIIKFIERVGFPVFVAVWVLIIQQKALNRLTAAINHLTNAVDGDSLIFKSRKRGGD